MQYAKRIAKQCKLCIFWFSSYNKKDGRVIEKNDYTKTAVYIKKMTEKEIKEYVKTGEPLDKAGSYAIQGIGGKFIDKIEGSYNNVVGMDTEKLAKYLGED